MIHIKAYPPCILYQSPYRSAQISDLADIHLTFRFQAALPVIVSPAQRSSKTGRRAQSEIIFQAILPWFYFWKFLTKLQIWHEFHSHFFCFLSLYDTTGHSRSYSVSSCSLIFNQSSFHYIFHGIHLFQDFFTAFIQK